MDKESMDPHVQAGLYGTPQINPDEQRHYLGNFRERIYLLQTSKNIGDSEYMTIWDQQLKKHSDATLYLNGHLDRAVLDKFIKLAAHNKMHFTLKTDAVYNASDVMVVLAAKTAVHQEVVDIHELVGTTSSNQTNVKTEKKPWYKKLF